MATVKCNKCGNKFKGKENELLCPDCKRRRTPKIYFGIAITIIVLGFIGGIIIGNTYTNRTLTYESSIDEKYNEYEEEFNAELMLECWVGTTILSIFIFGIGSTNYRLNLLIDNKKEN